MKGLFASVAQHRVVSVVFNLYYSSTIMEILTCITALFSFYFQKKKNKNQPTDKIYSEIIKTPCFVRVCFR